MSDISLPVSSVAEERKEGALADYGDVKSQVPWFLRFLLIAALLFLTLATLTEYYRSHNAPVLAPKGPGPSDQEIVPGIRVGFITLQLSIKEVEDRLGAGKVEPTEKDVVYRFDAASVKCIVVDRHVTSVLTSDPQFHTRTGLHVGSAVEDVIRTYGDRYEFGTSDATSSPAPGPDKTKPYNLQYIQQGTHFNIYQNSVRSIWVTPGENING